MGKIDHGCGQLRLCMSMHVRACIQHYISCGFSLHNFHIFSYFGCSAKERDGDRRCKNILLPFLAHNLLKKTLNLICCFCCCCKWVLKYTHKMLPIYTMHTHTYRADICVCDCVCECVYVIMWNCVFVGVCVMCVLYRYTTIYKRRRYDDNQKTQLAAGECKN